MKILKKTSFLFGFLHSTFGKNKVVRVLRGKGTQNEVLSLTARCVFVGTASHSKTPLPLALRTAENTPFRNSMGFHKKEGQKTKGKSWQKTKNQSR
jgi:hypothetical protein